MDNLTNFSLKYTEIEDETFFCDTYRNDVMEYVNRTGEITPENCPSSGFLTPMMFSRQSSLDSFSTTSWDEYSVQSDYSHQISSRVSPSDIPDSPSEAMPQSSYAFNAENDGSSSNEDDTDKNLLDSCLQLGISAMLRSNTNRNGQIVKYTDSFILSEDECPDWIEKDKNLLEKCWWNGINAFQRNAHKK